MTLQSSPGPSSFRGDGRPSFPHKRLLPLSKEEGGVTGHIVLDALLGLSEPKLSYITEITSILPFLLCIHTFVFILTCVHCTCAYAKHRRNSTKERGSREESNKHMNEAGVGSGTHRVLSYPEPDLLAGPSGRVYLSGFFGYKQQKASVAGIRRGEFLFWKKQH